MGVLFFKTFFIPGGHPRFPLNPIPSPHIQASSSLQFTKLQQFKSKSLSLFLFKTFIIQLLIIHFDQHEIIYMATFQDQHKKT